MCLVASGFGLLLCSPAHAQGGVPLVTVATDQTPLPLSDQFGVPSGSAINQAGDFAFVGNGNTALFFRAAGASAATRLLQIEDQAPGFPDSQIRYFSPLIALNAAKLLLFEVIFTSTEGIPREALLTYDGANYHTVVSVGDIAPAPDSVAYTSLTPGSVDDQGDINFSASLFGKSGITYYIVPSGGMPVRVAATSDTPPAACIWCSPPPTSSSGGVLTYVFQLVPPPLNKQGQMLLSLWGGLFVGSKDGLSLVLMGTSGPCSPMSNSVPPNPLQLFSYGRFLNDSGVVSFTNPSTSGSAICVAQPGVAATATITSGMTAPAGIGGGTLNSPNVLGMDASGDLIFQSIVLGSNLTPFTLLRYHQSNSQMDIIAYDGEQAPGTNGSTFSFLGLGPFTGQIISAFPVSAVSSLSMANDGRASFRAPLSKGGNAIYRQTSANTPEFIFLDGEPSPFIGIGIRPFAVSPGVETKILDNGSTFFSAYLTNGAADFAEFLGTPGNVQTLMSTVDILPTGARTILPATSPQAAGHYVAFTAQPAAGRNNLFLSDTTSGTITRVVSDNDPAFATAGGEPGDTVLAPNFFLNESGQVAFETLDANAAFGGSISSIGFGTGFANKVWATVTISNCGTIYLSSPPPAAGLTKIAAPGDKAPKTTNLFSCLPLNAEAPSPLNRSGQLAFSSPSLLPGSSCFLECIQPGTLDVNGVFLYSPGATSTISEIAAANDTLPGETQQTTLVPDIPVSVNSTGQVAFGAQIGTPISGFQGLFVRNADGTLRKVVSSGDSVPDSTTTATFTAPTYITGLDDNGNLTFRASTSSATDGIFFAPTGGSVQTIALDGGAAPASVGGKFALDLPYPITGLPPGGFLPGTPFSSGIALSNAESDIAFYSVIVGGNANSGYFRQREGASGLQPVVLQGQPVPGGGNFTTIETPGLGGDFTLGPDGALAFVAGFLSNSGSKRGLFVARPDGSIMKVLTTGDTAPGGGVLNSLALSHGLAASEAGKFVFWAGIRGGSARQAIFVTAIPPGTAVTTATLAALQPPVLALQPVALTATVVRDSNVAALTGPTGKVNFFDNGTSLGNGALGSNGNATLMTSSLVGGPHSLVAQYDGDAIFAPADSPAVTTIVTGFAAPPTGLAVTAGKTLQIPLVLYASANSTFTFMLSCPGLPPKASCAFDQNQVTPGPTGTPIMVTLSTMANSNVLPHRPRKGPGPLGLLELSAILSVLLTTAVTKLRLAPRRRLAFGMSIAAFGLAVLMAGCGVVGSGSTGTSGTPPGPAAITVTGASGTTTVSTVVNVTVQ